MGVWLRKRDTDVKASNQPSCIEEGGLRHVWVLLTQVFCKHDPDKNPEPYRHRVKGESPRAYSVEGAEACQPPSSPKTQV